MKWSRRVKKVMKVNKINKARKKLKLKKTSLRDSGKQISLR